MLRLGPAVFVFLLVVLSACDSGEDSVRAEATTPVESVTPAVETTPVRGSSVLRLDTLELVYEAFVEGRVPAGLVNEVTIALASADISGFYIGEEFGQDLYLDLSIVALEARRDLIESGGHSYEWWFTSIDRVGSGYPVQISPADPELKAALRFVDDAWGLYVDEGTGWTTIDGTFAFGIHEVTARVRIDETWRATDLARHTYMRALIRHEQPTADGYQVGDAYPRDGAWNVVTN